MENLLYHGFSFPEDEKLLTSKFKMFSLFLYLSIFFTTLFAILSEFGINDIGPQAKVDYVCGFLSLIILIFFRRSKENFSMLASIFTALLFITFTLALINVPQDGFRLIWFYVVVYVAYSLLNQSIGLLVTVLSILAIILSNIYFDLQLPNSSIYTAVLGLILISAVLRIHDDQVSEYQNSLLTILDSLQESNNEIERLNSHLKQKVQKEVSKNREKEKYIQQQARKAQMGEMISMIAHQWKQPLGAIAATCTSVRTKTELGIFNLDTQEGKTEQENFIRAAQQKVETYINVLVDTMDDFRNFFKTDKKTVHISLQDVVDKSLNLLRDSLNQNNITVNTYYSSEKTFDINDTEILQVMLIILKNAEDNFIEKNIQNPKIDITTKENKLLISDNGGGIPEDVMTKVFEPYFSTKDEEHGTGLGLYLAKLIVEDNHHSRIDVYNTNNGVCFEITFLTQEKHVHNNVSNNDISSY